MRTDMMVQVPQIALLCYEIRDQLNGVVVIHLLPLIIKTLTDTEESLRKTAQTALVMLIEQNLVSREAIEAKVCPVVLMLADVDAMPDYHPCAVTLMSKIAPLVGREKAMELFLDHFVDLCYVADLYVRTVCAASIPGFCTLMDTEVTERVLLPCFVDLCKDNVWGVRVECANFFLTVSSVVSLTTRREVLAPILIGFLRDESRWVRIPAFSALGIFIWTLAPESVRNPDSCLPTIKPNTPVPTHPQDLFSQVRTISAVGACENRFAKPMMDPMLMFNDDVDPIWEYFSKDESLEESFYGSTGLFDDNPSEEPSSKEEMSCVPEIVETTEVSEPENDFNAFLYWRLPLPDVGPDLCIGDVAEPENNCSNVSSVETSEEESTPVTPSIETEESIITEDQHISSQSTEDTVTLDREKMEVSWSSASVNGSSECKDNIDENKDSPSSTSSEDKEGGSCKKELAEAISEEFDRVPFNDGRGRNKFEARHKQGMYSSPSGTPRCTSDSWAQTRKVPAAPTGSLEQDIVPQALVDHYVSMSTLIIDDEADMTHYCAFSFPAVALTLGREKWPLLSGAYEALAANMQWKVRHSMASSIHELAVLLGEELSTQYLVPVFIGFLKDLDEVRIGFVKHLAEFLELIGPEGRSKCLPSLLVLSTSGGGMKWRFRAELTKQLMKVTHLFTPEEVRNYLSKIGIALLLSPMSVAALRHNALLMLAEHIRYLSTEKVLLESLLQKLAKDLAQSNDWVLRQCYAFLCEQLFVPYVREFSGDLYDDDGDEENEDEEEEGAEQTNGDAAPKEEEKKDDMEWRNRIAPLLAEYVFPNLLNLSSDRVPNVRIAVARVLGVIQLTPTEQSYLQSVTMDESGHSDGSDIKKVPSLEMALKRLQDDDDFDVHYFAHRHHVSETSGHQLSCPTIEDTVG